VDLAHARGREWSPTGMLNISEPAGGLGVTAHQRDTHYCQTRPRLGPLVTTWEHNGHEQKKNKVLLQPLRVLCLPILLSIPHKLIIAAVPIPPYEPCPTHRRIGGEGDRHTKFRGACSSKSCCKRTRGADQ